MPASPPPSLPRFASILLTGYGLLYVLALFFLSDAFVVLFDPSPPLGDTFRLCLRRSRMIFALLAVLFLSTALFVWKTRRGQSIFSRNVVVNALLLVGTLLPFLVIDRACIPPAQTFVKSTIFTRDAELGFRLQPNANDFFTGVPVKINGKGYRGPVVSYEKPDSILRILFLGDSVTFGYGIENDERLFPSLMAQYLQGSYTVETINAGVPGYMPWQHFAYLKREGIRYHPDLVVLTFVLNDISEKLDLAFCRDVHLSHTTLSTIERLTKKSGLIWIASTLGQWIRMRNKNKKEIADVRRLIEQPDAPDVARAWRETIRSLDNILTFCHERNLPVLLVVFPFTFQLEAPQRLDLPQRRLSAYAIDQRLPYIDVLPLFAKKMQESGVTPTYFFLDEDHLTLAGHEEVAQILAGYVLEKDVLNLRDLPSDDP